MKNLNKKKYKKIQVKSILVSVSLIFLFGIYSAILSKAKAQPKLKPLKKEKNVNAIKTSSNTKSSSKEKSSTLEKKNSKAPESEDVLPLQEYKKLNNKALNIKQAISWVLDNNLDLLEAKYNLLMSDSSYLKSQKKYAINLYGLGNYRYGEIADVGSSQATRGKSNSNTTYEVGVQKYFKTGTTIKLGVGQSKAYTEPGDGFSFPTAPGQPSKSISLTTENLYSTYINFGISQELLKNFLGANDRRSLRQTEIASKIQQANLLNLLNKLVVDAIMDYWNLSISEKDFETAKISLKNAIYLRNIIYKKRRNGLAEKHDVNRYNILVMNAKITLDQARNSLEDARSKIARTMNLKPGTVIKGVTELRENLPQNLDYDNAYREALKKRWDIRIVKMEMERAKLGKDIAKNNALPSITLDGSIKSHGDSDEGRSDTIGDTATGTNLDYSIGFKVTYPLWDKEVKASVRDAKLTLKAKKVAWQKIKNSIRDEIESSIRSIKTSYKVLQNTLAAKNESFAQYNNLTRQFYRGRFNVSAVTDAHNALVRSRFSEVRAKVNFNIALLKLQLSRNVLFEHYGLDVNDYLAKFKKELKKNKN